MSRRKKKERMAWWPAVCIAERREYAAYVESDQLVKWLTQQFGEDHVTQRIGVSGDKWSRRWYAWRNESRDGLICVYKVDEFFLDCFGGALHLSDLPDECFSLRKRRYNKNRLHHLPEAMAELDAGKNRNEVAAMFGVCKDTIGKWERRWAEEQAA